MKEILDMIYYHNQVIKMLQNNYFYCENPFKGMELYHNLACEGLNIVKLARAKGIPVKVNMQTGEIIREEISE